MNPTLNGIHPIYGAGVGNEGGGMLPDQRSQDYARWWEAQHANDPPGMMQSASFGGPNPTNGPPSNWQDPYQQSGLNWNPFTLPTGDTGYDAQAPGGGYYYYGPDGKVYQDPYPGEVHAGDLGNYTGMSASQLNGGGSGSSGGSASSLLPSPSQLGSFAPLPLQAFGNVPYLQPATYNAAQVDYSQMPGALNAFTHSLYGQLQPQFDQQKEQLNEQLNARGIFNSGAAQQMQTDLTGQQDAALAGGISPLIQQFAGYWNQAQGQNAQLRQEANAGNAASANAMNGQNADYYYNTLTGNANNYNGFLNNLFGLGTGYSNSLINSYLGSYGGPNGQVLGTMGNTPGLAGSAYQDAYGNAYKNSMGLGGAFSNALTGLIKQPAQIPDTHNYLANANDVWSQFGSQ